MYLATWYFIHASCSFFFCVYASHRQYLQWRLSFLYCVHGSDTTGKPRFVFDTAMKVPLQISHIRSCKYAKMSHREHSLNSWLIQLSGFGLKLKLSYFQWLLSRPDDHWTIQSKGRQVIFRAKVGNLSSAQLLFCVHGVEVADLSMLRTSAII